MKRMIKALPLLLVCVIIFSSCVLPDGFFTQETTQGEPNAAPQKSRITIPCLQSMATATRSFF